MTDGKKIKLYPAVKYAQWIKKLAKSHGVKSAAIVSEIVRRGIRWHGYEAAEIVRAGRAPEVTSEVHFIADARFVTDWEAFKTRMSKLAGESVGDTQVGRMLIARAYNNHESKTAPNKQMTFEM